MAKANRKLRPYKVNKLVQNNEKVGNVPKKGKLSMLIRLIRLELELATPFLLLFISDETEMEMEIFNLRDSTEALCFGAKIQNQDSKPSLTHIITEEIINEAETCPDRNSEVTKN